MQIYSPAGIIHFGSAHEDAFDVLSRSVIYVQVLFTPSTILAMLSCPDLADEPRLLAVAAVACLRQVGSAIWR
jgi:hypothetical protein